MNTVTSSHDLHIGKLLGKEDETRASEVRAMTEIVESRREEERWAPRIPLGLPHDVMHKDRRCPSGSRDPSDDLRSRGKK